MKIGFAITAYDKFEEAKILIEIINKEFKGNYKIAFCSNHPDGEKFAQENNIDSFLPGRNIPYFNGDRHNPNNIRDRISIVLRSTDTVQKSCQAALELDVDYIIHMHSDAWVLDEQKLIELVEELDSMGKHLAIRGVGLETEPVGRMDDHFFVFNRKYFKENNIMGFYPEEMWPHKFSVHEILFINFWVKLGLRNIWYYRNTYDLHSFDGKKVWDGGVRPISYDPYYNFIHIHRESFGNDFGKNLQAMYLKQASFDNSIYIKNFIAKYYIPPKKLIKIIRYKEKELNERLNQLHYTDNDHCIKSREFNYKNKIIQNTTKSMIMKNIFKKYKDKVSISSAISGKLKMDYYYRNKVNIDMFVEDRWTRDIYKNNRKKYRKSKLFDKNL